MAAIDLDPPPLLVKVITVDIHSPQSEAFFSIPVDCLTARFIFER